METTNYWDFLPSEILSHIFKYLLPCSLIRCRQVSQRWREIVDSLKTKDSLWRNNFENNYGDKFKNTSLNTYHGLSWYKIYKSISLWPKLLSATESVDEFASAGHANDEIKNFKILSNGIAGVHKQRGVEYYHAGTWVKLNQERNGDYLKYDEDDNLLVTLNFRLQLNVMSKNLLKSPGGGVSSSSYTICFDNVRTFLLAGNEVYYVNLNDEIFVCKLENRYDIKNIFLLRCTDGIMCLGYQENHLNILTFQRNIYALHGQDLDFKYSLDSNSNLFYILREFNFVNCLDWRIYFQWMYMLTHTVPQGPLRDIVTARTHGDIIFVGSNWGVLRIYYAPCFSEEFDIFNAVPLKQYNFMERADCPVLSICPIIQIDVIEIEDGHEVLVAMPKKIAILKFKHKF